MTYSYIQDKARKKYYTQVYNFIKEKVENTEKKSIDIELMFRYIDDNCEQDIIRCKRVYLKDDELYVFTDTWNGNYYAADIYFADDECFENEEETNLNISVVFSWNVMFIESIADDIEYYGKPTK